jgi:hypothetical protein
MEANGNHGAFVAQHDLGDPCANHSNSILAGADTLDYGDIRITYFVLDRCAEVNFVLMTRLPKRIGDWGPADAGTRPMKDLGGSMLAEHLCFDGGWCDPELSPQM